MLLKRGAASVHETQCSMLLGPLNDAHRLFCSSLSLRDSVLPMMLRSNRKRVIELMVLLVLVANPVGATASVWVSAPKPKFPAAALSRGSEGYVIVRTYVGQDGSVARATISKSSGDSTLDNAAQTAVLKWKMNPAVIKPEYLTKGYEQRIDFQQEVPVAARYRDRTAYFNSFRDAKIWTFAPFPEYPFHERLTRTEGIAVVRIIIGADGGVASVVLFKSSGNANLDNAAVSAVRRWRAHKEYAGVRLAVPIVFTMRGRR